jgi:outer membrane protein TolC
MPGLKCIGYTWSRGGTPQSLLLTNFANFIMLRPSMRKSGLIVALLASGAGVYAQNPPVNNAPPNANTNAPSAAAIVGGANTASNPVRPVGLAEVIQMALQSNLDVQVSRFNPQMAQYELSAAYSVYEPDLRFSYTHNNNTTPGGFDPETGDPFLPKILNSDTYAAGVGNSIAGYAPSGLTYSLGGSVSKQNISLPGTFGVDDYSGNAAINLRQPLLRNFWIDPARALIKIDRVNLRISEEALRATINDTLLRVEQAYYNLIFARENVKVQATALELASQLLRENRKRVEVGALAPLDEKQAESEVASTRAALIDAERTLSEQQNILKGLITDKYAEWNAVNIEPIDNLLAVPVIADVQESWRLGLNQRPDLMELKYALERAGITLKLRKNQLYPQLDLVGSYGHNERRNSYEDVLGQMPRGKYPRYSYGVVLDIPLGNRSARAAYKSAKADQGQSLLEYKRLEQQIMVQIDDSVKLIRSSFERVEATRAARAFAQEALAAEQKKLENGKSTSFFVLQFQRDLTARRSEEVRALADYNNALAQLAFREGTTLERHKILMK